MKVTHAPFGKPALKSGLPRTSLNCREHIRSEVTRVKQSALDEFSAEAGEHVGLLRLALTEAEALAWQTEYPHLVFPVLAAEKARATVRWQKRQRAVWATAPQLSLAE